MMGGILAPFLRLTPVVRVAALLAGVVALGAGVLSWDALRWGAGELGVDPALTWVFPIVLDGVILGATVGALAVRKERLRTRAYVWVLLGASLGASVLGNAAHAGTGGPPVGPFSLHQLGSASPAVALAAMLHVLVIIVRATGAPRVASGRLTASPRTRPRRGVAARLEALQERAEGALSTDQLARKLRVSAGHVRKLSARQKRAEGAA